MIQSRNKAWSFPRWHKPIFTLASVFFQGYMHNFIGSNLLTPRWRKEQCGCKSMGKFSVLQANFLNHDYSVCVITAQQIKVKIIFFISVFEGGLIAAVLFISWLNSSAAMSSGMWGPEEVWLWPKMHMGGFKWELSHIHYRRLSVSVTWHWQKQIHHAKPREAEN